MSDRAPSQGAAGAASNPLPWKWQLGIAVGLLAVFGALVVVMLVTAGDTNPGAWERRVYVFGAVEAIVFTAVGWIFGREVHRSGAESARQDAAEAKGDAKDAQTEAKQKAEQAAAERTKGAKLAAAVRMATAADAAPAPAPAAAPSPRRGQGAAPSQDAGLAAAGAGAGAAAGGPPTAPTTQLAALGQLAQELYPD